MTKIDRAPLINVGRLKAVIDVDSMKHEIDARIVVIEGKGMARLMIPPSLVGLPESSVITLDLDIENMRLSSYLTPHANPSTT